MTHFFRRTALVLLAGTTLGAAPALAQPAPATGPEQAVAAPGVDAFYRARRHKAAAGPAATYRVKKGDTLAEVADKLGTSVEALAKANRLKSPYRLSPGQTLKNPNARKASAAAEPKASGRKSARAESQSYVVKSGDTLFSISKRFGVTVAELKAANGLGRSNSIPRGRRLSIPGPGGAEPAEVPEFRTTRKTEPAFEDTGSERAAAGRVITIETAGKAYRVRKGESLARVASKMGVDADDLIRINHLKRPYRLRAGQTLRGPGGSAKAYVVARGDTLASVAERFGVSVDKLRTTNGLRRGAALSPGRHLRLPAGFRDSGPAERTEPPPRPAYTPTSPASPPPPRGAELPGGPQPYVPPRNAPPPYRPPSGPVSGAPTSSPAVSDAQIMQMGRGLFQWPLKGRVLSGFGDKGAGQRNDGMNIAASAGEPVRAAAAGDVVYAGDQVPGFGNLVLIKHADGWVTAYGHLGKVGVRMQQKVAQGEQIGEAGSTGGVTEPQLHFEVRYAPTPQERARPVDPALVLPK